MQKKKKKKLWKKQKAIFKSIPYVYLSNAYYTPLPLLGMWSSIFSKNLLDAWHAADNSEDFWHRWTQDKVTEIGKSSVPFDLWPSSSRPL